MPKLTTFFIFLSILLYPIQGESQQTANPNWTEPEIVSGNLPGKPKDFQLAARKDGGALLVWAQAFVDTSANTDEIFFREFDGSQWSPIRNISNSPSFSRGPLVISDSRGDIHTFWLEKLGDVDPRIPRGYTDIFYSYRTGNLWSEPQSIYHTDIALAGINPMGMDITLDHEDQLHVLWMAPVDLEFLYTRTEKMGKVRRWNLPKKLFPGGMADMAVDATNTLHVAFAYTLGAASGLSKAQSLQRVNDLFYSYSKDGGRTWADPVLVHDSGTQPAYYPKIAVDRFRRIHILWAKDYDYDLFPDDILHSFSTDGHHWSEPVSITGLKSGTSFPPTVVVDQNNRIHAIWHWTQYFGSDTNLLYYVRWENNTWSEPVLLFKDAGAPSLCIDAFGTLHLAWLNVHRIDEDRREARILHSQATIVSGIASSSPIPSSFELYPNYPNPFNVETVIRYWMPVPEHVRLKVYDLRGREIQVLIDEVASAGPHEVRFDGSQLPSGVYFYQFEVAGHRKVKKMILLR